MASNIGYFMGGLAKGLTSGANLGMQITQLRWQKKKQKELDDLTVKMNDSWNSIGQELISLANDGQLSEDDKLKIYTLTIAAPYEMQGVMQNLRSSLAQFDTKGFDSQMELIKTFYDYAQGMDVTDIDVLYETFRGYITDPHASALFEVADKKLRHEVEIRKEEEPWRRAATLPSEMRVPYLKQEGIQMPEVAPKFTFNEKRFNWKIEQYNLGNITFDQLLKGEGMYIAPEKATGLEKQIQDIKAEGERAGIDPAKINKAIQDKILGREAGALTPTPTSVENTREAIKNAPTIEDAKRIEKNHIAKFGDTLGIPSVDKFWSDERVRRLDTLKQGIDKLLDENKWLKKGTITSAEVGFEIEDDIQKVEAVYQQLREEYMKYFDMLTKMGLPLLEFPTLKPLEEIEKVGLGEGFWGFGKQKGQYKSIYY